MQPRDDLLIATYSSTRNSRADGRRARQLIIRRRTRFGRLTGIC